MSLLGGIVDDVLAYGDRCCCCCSQTDFYDFYGICLNATAGDFFRSRATANHSDVKVISTTVID
ncbi:uncharacterized protein MELLADRAFT_54430 [Melampsora larici-populina 98AG31]|uniref:Uncharacterized protein n=1 Tax=Melampsora larici-populina (strain 98AG31 / pathotype 3-4-7) TaxID=747676 RepID=F4R3J6_MELLP|nr:uncharacterized protein MELLADRAFT_54430 [Melampsora larici-populina 98AG31]EGG13157.1 hypothetical protein MELLADRAFT_54430 [Melampsora larici-populina 98AG31]